MQTNILNRCGKLAIAGVFTLIVSAVGVSAATITVTNTNDSGAGSLRDAINQANTNAQADTINFDPVFFNVARTITLTSGEIAIGPDGTNPGRLVTINGPGANLLTISGNNISRIFLLGPQFNANVAMNNLTLRDGNGVGFADPNGGAIFAQVAANLTLNSMTIRNNVITAVGSGGAIYSNSSGNVVINDSLITENSAYNAGGMLIDNGQDKQFTMRNTIVSNNTATPGDVGGITIIRGTSTIENSRITGNVATRSWGGMFINGTSRLNISDTEISGNDGMQNNGGGLNIDTTGADFVNLRRLNVSNNTGTGISVRHISGVFTLIESTVSNNTLRDYPGFSGEGGGGIAVSGESTAPIKIINTTISGNTVPDAGGGIYNFTFGLELINSTVMNNTVTNVGTAKGGGGIYDGEVARSGGNGFLFRVKLQNSIIAGNTAATGPDLYSGFDSAGHNIIGNTANTNGSSANTGDQFNVNPNVGDLADNGGSTQTHALLAGSPAINMGSNALAVDQNGNSLRFDQRGACFNRYIGGTTDIGAYEFGAVQLAGENAFIDFDGDCKTDVSTFRPNGGGGSAEWWYLNSSDGGNGAFSFGTSTDTPVPADFTGDGKTDVAFWRPSTGEWYVIRSEDSTFFAFPFGSAGDVPMPGDFDGDGEADATVFRPSANIWFTRRSSDGQVTTTPFGAAGDKPVAADFDGDGKTDIAIYRPNGSSGGGEWWYQRSSDGGNRAFAFGSATDKAVPADFTGDGKADLAFWRPSTGEWYVVRSEDDTFFAFPFGVSTDIPVPGDYDGDGKADAAIFRPSENIWYLLRSTAGFQAVAFGATGDRPLPNSYVR